MKRAYSLNDIMARKFNVLPFEGVWLDAVGRPELAGSWIVYGSVKNGKTSFSLSLARYMQRFGDVFYNSVEEGISLSFQGALRRTANADNFPAGHRFLVGDRESVDELVERLIRKGSPDVVVIDTAQLWNMKARDYERLRNAFPGKLFIYTSHTSDRAGNCPKGDAALLIYKDAMVSFRIEGFKAFPISRYGGGKPIVICRELAEKYWLNK
jgi:hypothetical protein